MKGFIACVLAMAPVVASWDLARPVHVALTYDEEVGCHGAKVMLADLARSRPRPAIALVGEPTDEAIVIAHKGCYEYTTEIRGVERHASISAAGAGAIHAAARFVGMLDRLADEMADRAPADSPFAPPGTTFNVGTISGGVARNITAGERCSNGRCVRSTVPIATMPWRRWRASSRRCCFLRCGPSIRTPP